LWAQSLAAVKPWLNRTMSGADALR
jgi:hypothetical protein